jgi:hypothetical protein
MSVDKTDLRRVYNEADNMTHYCHAHTYDSRNVRKRTVTKETKRGS